MTLRSYVRKAALAALAFSALTLSACGAGGGIPSSTLSLRAVDDDRLISTARDTGELELTVGEEFQFRVVRLTADSDNTDSDEVTTVCRYYFIPSGIAEANSLGVLKALEPGTTRMEARFRTSGLDVADRVYLNVRVNPAPEEEVPAT
ncbi:hypothetical protein IT575_07145 [bacterium]|nr:hypothetical protein [bacterium]